MVELGGEGQVTINGQNFSHNIWSMKLRLIVVNQLGR